MRIRNVEPSDTSAILNIYSYYIEATAITFEWSIPTLDEFKSRIASIRERYPYIVAIDNGRIVGYSYLNAYSERKAYSWCAELSIYLDKDYRGRGIGKELLANIEGLGRAQNIRKILSCIAVSDSNDKHLPSGSVEFHKRNGFSECGYIRNAGFKFSRWWDIAWYDKNLAGFSPNPDAFIPRKELKLQQK